MSSYYKLFFVILLLLSLRSSFAQLALETKQKYPQDYFRSPLDIPLLLSGTFGELRPNHFHGGIDIKTQKREGLNVYAAADGYVSRINVSGKGYGNALYITHPNGYVSVYAHLKSFNWAIKKFLRERQYAEQKNEIDIQVSPDLLPVSKGGIIALSGNSGGSQAPHLHFEIRDAATEETINPLLFGFNIIDNIAPRIQGTLLYTFDSEDHPLSRQKITPIKFTDNNETALPLIFVNSPYIAVAVASQDALNNSDGNNGIYSLMVQKDEATYFTYEMERFRYSHTRCIHAHMDYQYYETGGSRYHRIFRLPGDMLEAYRNEVNRGIIILNESEISTIAITSDDAHGNKVRVGFRVKYNGANNNWSPPSYDKILFWDESNQFYQDDIQCDFGTGLFYEDVLFRHSTIPSSNNTIYSDIHLVHKDEVPVHTYFDIALRAKNIPMGNEEKAIIIYEDESGKKLNKGGTWDGVFIRGKAREFGTFYIMIDEKAPVITPMNVGGGKAISNNAILSWKIQDNLSGINSFNLYIDNAWHVLEYDSKTNKVWHTLTGTLSSGTHTILLVVKDERNNVSEYKSNIQVI